MTLVKICGLTTAEDALAALESGADMLGLNFYPGSPRYLDLDAAGVVVTALPPAANLIGVFVDPVADEVFRALERLHLSGVQLHGHETPQLIATIMPRVRVIKAVRTRAEAEQALACGCQLLLDAPSPLRGGSGKLSDWTLARELSTMTPHFYLAGGLTPENVSQAIKSVRPFAVDVASGVELSPRQKSKSAMEAFVKAAKMGEAYVQHPG